MLSKAEYIEVVPRSEVVRVLFEEVEEAVVGFLCDINVELTTEELHDLLDTINSAIEDVVYDTEKR